MKTLLPLLSLTLLMSPLAYAQDEVGALDELDELDAETEEITKPTERQVTEEEPKLAEVVRGAYAQAMLTDLDFIGMITLADGYAPVGDTSNYGLGVKTAFGYDFIDAPRFTMAAEASYAHGAYNGLGAADSSVSLIQGDFRGHFLQAGIRPGVVLGKSRRFSLYARAGGGVFYSGLTVSEESLPVAGVHGTFKPYGMAGLGLEYYSKLSHVSFTLFETEFFYVTGFDAALSFNFAGMKYTF